MTLSEKNIDEDISQLRGLQIIAESYEEIASSRMKKSRGTVLSKRDFISDIENVFDQVKNAYARKIIELAKTKNGNKGAITFISHNGKNVAVFLSANTGLYGDIINKTFDMFIKEVREEGSEVTIVGRHGLSLFLQEMPSTPYTFFDLPDYGSKSSELEKIVEHIVQYEAIHVYYGKFMNVANQKPEMYSISANLNYKDAQKENKKLYLFEPSLEKILVFFEKEIFASLFEQTVSESDLSKSASRMIAMDKASSNVKRYLTELKNEKMKAHHRQFNKKQLNFLASIV